MGLRTIPRFGFLQEPVPPRREGLARAAGSAAAVCIVLLASIPFSAAQEDFVQAVSGDLEFSQIHTDDRTRLDATTRLFALPYQTFELGRERWTFQADSVLINETYEPGVRLEAAYSNYAIYESKRYREARLDAVRGELQRSGEFSYLLAYPPVNATGPTERFDLAADHFGLRLSGVPRLEFETKQLNRGSTKNDSSSTVRHTDPSPQVHGYVERGAANLTFRGSFTFQMFDMDVRFESHGSTRTVPSGYVVAKPGAGVRQLLYVSPHDEKVTLRITFHNATLLFEPNSRPYELFLQRAQLRIVGALEFDDASGKLRTKTRLLELQKSPLRLTSADVDVIVESIRSSQDVGRLEGKIEGVAGKFNIDGRVFTEAAAPRRGSALAPFLVGATMVAGVGLGFFTTYQRRRLRNPDEAARAGQEALNRGRFARAEHCARAALVRDPNHGPAFTVLVASLLRTGRPQEVLDALRLQSAGHGADVASLALVRGLALLDLGQLDEAVKETDRALQLEPAFERDLLGTHLHDQVVARRTRWKEAGYA